MNNGELSSDPLFTPPAPPTRPSTTHPTPHSSLITPHTSLRPHHLTTQGIRSMVYSSSREAAAIELVLGLIDEAHESVEAHWQWPSTFVDYKELDDDYKELGDKGV